jgi:hypothetical protein
MKHNIIKTENYLLAVDDSEIKYDDHFIDEYKMLYMLKTESTEKYKSVKKVISHLPLNEAPLLEGVPLLPPFENEVEEVWEQGLGAELEKLPYTKHLDDGQYNDGQLAGFEFGATWGYNKAKEKYKYTEEDLSKAIDMARNGNRKVIDTKGVEYLFILQEDKIIQSLQQSKMPVAFECEIFEAKDLKSVDGDWLKLGKPKTTTNPQGQTVLVGKYIY